MSDSINSVQTLYVPPVSSKPVQNEQLAADIEDADHLGTITVDDESQSL
jgi:hypothetical protein